jgi:hypothetical protein
LLIQGYMDETGIHDGAAITGVAAYFSNAQTWKHFTRRWLHVLRDFDLNETDFHMIDYTGRQNAFKGWSTGDQLALGKKLFPLIPRHTRFGVSIAIHNIEFEELFKTYPNIKRGLGRPYTCCFQWLITLVAAHLPQPDPAWRIGCIHEDNDYKGEAIEAWDWVKKKEDIGSRLGLLAFAPKIDCVPLQAADVLAWESQKRLSEPNRAERKSLSILRPNITLQMIDKKWLAENAPRLDRLAAEGLEES